ncbi:hypothetical protein SAU060112_10392 [Staphylococcus aureus]|nr:hypothetical protein SAU060112_10392 [Staphylococcus aureus]
MLLVIISIWLKKYESLGEIKWLKIVKKYLYLVLVMQVYKL